MNIAWHVRSVGTLVCLLWISLLNGCVAQQADLKSAERRFNQSNEALAQRGAQQRQELEELKSQELPKLRGELEKAQHQAQEIQRAQDDLRIHCNRRRSVASRADEDADSHRQDRAGQGLARRNHAAGSGGWDGNAVRDRPRTSARDLRAAER